MSRLVNGKASGGGMVGELGEVIALLCLHATEKKIQSPRISRGRNLVPS